MTRAAARQLRKPAICGSVDPEGKMVHLGSAHTQAEVELLKAAARQKFAAGGDDLDLSLSGMAPRQGGPLPVTSSRMGHLWDALEHAYRVLGFEATVGDSVSRDLVLARIIEPTSTRHSARVLGGSRGERAPAYRTMTRRLPVFALKVFRRKLRPRGARQTGLGPGHPRPIRREPALLRDRCRGRTSRSLPMPP